MRLAKIKKGWMDGCKRLLTAMLKFNGQPWEFGREQVDFCTVKWIPFLRIMSMQIMMTE